MRTLTLKVKWSFCLAYMQLTHKQAIVLKDHIRLFDTDDEEDMLEHYLAEKSDASAPKPSS